MAIYSNGALRDWGMIRYRNIGVQVTMVGMQGVGRAARCGRNMMALLAAPGAHADSYTRRFMSPNLSWFWSVVFQRP